MASAVVDIDAIVREVVRRLRALDGNGAIEKGPQLSNGADNASSLEISERVITLSTLDKRLTGIQRITVKPKAIVTPAVVDELKDRNIELIRCRSIVNGNLHNSNKPTKAGMQRVATTNRTTRGIVFATNSNADALAKQLANVSVVDSNHESIENLLTKIDQHISRGELAVLLTGTPSAAVVEANRNKNIRAAVGFSFPAVRQAVDEAGANLLAIDPSGKSNQQLAAMINEFLERN